MFRFRRLLLPFSAATGVSLILLNHETLTNYKRHFKTAFAVGSILLDYKRELPDAHQRGAEKLLEMFRSNGGIYIKLGQHISSLVYLVPKEYIQVLSALQDECCPSSMESVKECVEKEFGIQFEQIFNDFQENPIGVGSLAQVHKAKMKIHGNETVVAVKVQYPKLQRQAADDILVCSLVCSVIKFLVPNWELGWLVDEMEINLPIELDFSNEMINANRTRQLFNGNRDLYLPKFYYSSNTLVVMEYLVGAKLTDKAKLKEWNIDGNQVGLKLAKIFNEMIFKYRFVHCDPHGGNTLVIPTNRQWYHLLRPKFQIGLLDHGLYRTLEAEFVRNYAGMWLAIIQSDEEKMKYYTSKLFYKTKPNFHRLLSSMISARSWSAISGSRIASSRADEEITNVKEKTKNAQFLEAVVNVLAHCPRDLLFVFKINDLLRAGCEGLGASDNQFAKNMILQLGRYSMQQIWTPYQSIVELLHQTYDYLNAFVRLTTIRILM